MARSGETREPRDTPYLTPLDPERILRLLNQAGVEEMKLVSTNHDGHHGVIILGRKTAEPYQS